MSAIMLKYVQLLCVAFFMKNSNCSSLMDLELEEKLILSASMADCMNNSEVSDSDKVICIRLNLIRNLVSKMIVEFLEEVSKLKS